MLHGEDDIDRISIVPAVGKIMSRQTRSMRKRVLKSYVRSVIIVLESEITRQQCGKRAGPANVRKINLVMDNESRGGCRKSLGRAACKP